VYVYLVLLRHVDNLKRMRKYLDFYPHEGRAVSLWQLSFLSPLRRRFCFWLILLAAGLSVVNAQNPLDTFTRNFPITGKLPTCWLSTCCQQVVVMEFGKRHDTTDTTDFCPRQIVADLLRTCRYVADLQCCDQ